MVLDLFKNLSDNGELIVIESGKALRDQLLGVDWSEMVILANGRKVSPDYEPHEDDYLVIRRLHGSTAVVAWIAIAVAVIGGIAAGVSVYKAKQQQRKLKELQEQLSARDDVSNIPWLQGAANGVATGKSQPYIIGEHLFTPYLLQRGFYKISGTDGINQDYYTVLEGGFCSQAIKKISADESTIHDFGNQTAPQTGQTRPTGGIWQYRSGVNDNLIQIGQAGSGITLDEFKYKRAVDEPNVQLPWRDVCEQWTATKTETYTERVWVEINDDRGYWRNVKRTRTVEYQAGEVKTETVKFTLDKYAMNVEICLMFNGLCAYNDEGKKKDHTRNIGFRYSTNGGSTWSALTMSGTGPTSTSTSGGYFVCTFTRKTTSQIRFNLTHSFTASEAWSAGANYQPIIVEVTNRDVASTSTGGAYEDAYVQQVLSKIYDPENSSSSSLSACKVIDDRENNVSTVIGLKLRASAENEDKLGKINLITSGVARTWSGSAWSSSKTATRNPAAWILEVLTSSTHPASQFADSEIDLPSLGALYTFCANNGFNIDMVLTAGQKKDAILEAICNVCRCMLYRNIYGKISVAIDQPKENAQALLNAQNIRDIEITKSMGRQVDGLKLSWVNAAAGYVQDEYVCMRSGVTRTADSIIREMDVTGITNYNHLVKYARYIMAGERLRPKAIKVTTGLEGVYYTPFSKLLMQDDSLRVGLGNAVIRNVVTAGGNIIALQLEEAVDLDTAHDFGVIVQCVSDTYCTPLALAINQGGRTEEIVLTDPISIDAATIPHAGDILSYGYIENGEFDKITSEYLITGIEPKSDGVTLTLIDYDPDVYTTGPYGDYKPNITRKTEPYVPVIIPPAEVLSKTDEVLSGDNIAPPDTPTGVTALATENGLVVSCLPPDDSLLSNSIAKIVWEYAPDGIRPEVIITDPTFYAYEPVTSFTVTIPWPGGYPERSDLETWLVRVKFVSVYGKESEYSTYTTVDYDDYGTWQVKAPVLTTRTNKRSLHITMAQPTPATPAARVLGNVRYQVQISRYDDLDGQTRLWYQPNLYGDPYGAETNYRSTLGGYVIVTNDFAITVPLEGQTDDPPDPSDTVYYFKVTPFNEIGTQPGVYTISGQLTAKATGARDVVLARLGDGSQNPEALTAKNIYAENLAAISAIFAQISDSQEEQPDNVWNLETGEFRVGNDRILEEQGSDAAQYIHYVGNQLTIKLKNLIVSAIGSYLKGLLSIIPENESETDHTIRHFLTKDTSLLQQLVEGSWQTITGMTWGGLEAPRLYKDGTLIIGNTADGGNNGEDFGYPYISSNARAYHFDTNRLDNKGNSIITISNSSSASAIPSVLADQSYTTLLDLTPPFVAPYSIQKVLYGTYSLSLPLGTVSSFAITFAFKYKYNLGQPLFEFTIGADKYTLQQQTDEPAYNTTTSGGIYYNTSASGGVYYNTPYAGNRARLIHTAPGVSPGLWGVNMVPDAWYKVAITGTTSHVAIFIYDEPDHAIFTVSIPRTYTGAASATMVFNSTKSLAALDELMYDTTTAMTNAQIAAYMASNSPWGALNPSDDYLLINAADPAKVKSNCFYTKAEVTALMLAKWPVGSIYINTTNTNPGSFIGGVWIAFGEGRVLIGAGAITDARGESATFNAGDTGGEMKHKLDIDEMPAHDHGVYAGYDGGGAPRPEPVTLPYIAPNYYTSGANPQTWVPVNSRGSGQAHNNMQPYIVVYMWKRTS